LGSTHVEAVAQQQLHIYIGMDYAASSEFFHAGA
jgi:hypothetical protein